MSLFKSHSDVRCPVCLAEWNQREMMHHGVKGCPYCKTALAPLKVEQDGYVKLNWQDLRVLTIYSMRWTSVFDLTNQGNVQALKALQNIIESLKKYQPKGGAPLVLQEEVVIINKAVEPKATLIHETEKMDLTPDHTGMIPSPFFRKLGPIE